MKEHEDAPEPVIVAHAEPQRVTRARLEALRAEASAAKDEARRAFLQERVASAILVAPPADRSSVAFGAQVAVEDAGRPGTPQRFELVDEADVDIPHGRIGMESPLAQALLGSHVGDRVTWKRPAGDRTLVVTSIEYSA